MLRKRSRSIQKDQQMGDQITSGGGDGVFENCSQSDVLGQRQKTNSFFNNVPGLFVGLNPMCASDCDSVRSPTSPLDFKLFSNLSCSIRFPKPSQDGNRKCWVCDKVGLGSIVDSVVVDDDANVAKIIPEKIVTTIPSSNSKTILLGSQVRSKGPNSPTRAGVEFCEEPKSLPKNYPIFPNTKLLRPSNLQKGSSDVLFEIGDDPLDSDSFGKVQSFSLDSKRLGSEIYRLGARNADLRTRNSGLGRVSFQGGSGSDLLGGRPSSENKLTTGPMLFASGRGNEIARSLTPEEVELSEDYTCVISHGPNPKTTHIFGDFVLESHPNGIDSENKSLDSGTIMPCFENCLEMPAPSPYPTDDFLSYCYYCKKKLEQGKDIYMYRGEKAFCSCDCRLEMISIEEEQEISVSKVPKSENGDDIFEKSIFVAI